ncbi:thioredoxin domain-containing protein [Candidatus Saccharibacteria bacterium]|jgi:protein-disulfide isomerase|nr:thioredoxin domain-containing protein [Candidatus Saccharibacteria bacterium]
MEGKKFYIGLVVVVVAVIGGFAYLNQPDKTSSKTETVKSAKTVNKIYDEDYVIGNKDAKVILVEYGDFQCPACGGYYSIQKQAEENYKPEDVAFVFRGLPLTSLHPNALAAHRAAESAGLQGKFHEMHDKLYENQQEWSTVDKPAEVFDKYAKDIGLDVAKFKDDVTSDAVSQRIKSDQRSADRVRAESTPTIFIDGKKVEDQINSYEILKEKLDKALKEKGEPETPKTNESK